MLLELFPEHYNIDFLEARVNSHVLYVHVTSLTL